MVLKRLVSVYLHKKDSTKAFNALDSLKVIDIERCGSYDTLEYCMRIAEVKYRIQADTAGAIDILKSYTDDYPEDRELSWLIFEMTLDTSYVTQDTLLEKRQNDNSVSQRQGSLEIELYPNPAYDNLYLLISSRRNGPVNISLYNEIGELVMSILEDGEDSQPVMSIVNVQGYHRGTYFIMVTNRYSSTIKRVQIR
jgi:hypothetical protein